MHSITPDLMLDHVRQIYAAVTGTELPVPAASSPTPAVENVTAEQVAARFMELTQVARMLPQVARRVAPFTFVPPIDVIDRRAALGDLIVEIDLPGISPETVEVAVSGDSLVVSGVRGATVAANGQTIRWGEIPRGPFRRVVLLPPWAVSETLHKEHRDGVLIVTFGKKGAGGAKAKA